ncbi:hypothetical protein SEA_HANK144_33 [Streptomyces phage Hank144]|uniref:Uncharacterized protein n=1 Tax=Streptomyces phage Hank144 TaxID=2301573 RepID=A0A385DNX9_9CAUD|nr:hypothetical protein KGG76_gp33 [Streptomyces phage Hank144]AXQ61133.1 hypothetical protein SEA_HANK144_33 [Streptomyces phage Hank144]
MTSTPRVCKFYSVNEGDLEDTAERKLHTGRKSDTVDNDSEREEYSSQ